ncbi:MAG TPA: CHASE domain-containing protein [Candidatus Cybelea sp.]|nr:CHASE domain-containing protein [Candidatus Cybelea sp.]
MDDTVQDAAQDAAQDAVQDAMRDAALVQPAADEKEPLELTQANADAAAQSDHARRSLKWTFTAGLMLVGMCMGLTVWGAWYADRHERMEQSAALERRTGAAASVLRERLEQFEAVASGARALFVARPDVSVEQWNAFESALDLGHRDPGLAGLNYLAYVPGSRLTQAIAAMRSAGLGDIAVRPQGKRDTYCFEVFANLPEPTPAAAGGPQANLSPGLDHCSDPVARATLELARDSAKPLLTPPIGLGVGDADGPDARRSAVWLYSPVYGPASLDKSAANRALWGWVAARLDPVALINGIVPADDRSGMQLFDAAAPPNAPMLYDQAPAARRDGIFGLHEDIAARREIEFGGRTWALVSRDIYAPTGKAFLVATLGLAATLLLIAMLLSMRRIRVRAIALVDEKAAALVASEARYRTIIDDQTDMICRFLPDGSITFTNSAYDRSFGRAGDDMVGRNILARLAEGEADWVRDRLAKLTPENPTGTIDVNIAPADGEPRWQHWTGRAFFDSEGRATEYQLVGRDATEQVLAQHRLAKAENTLREAIEKVAEGLWLYDANDKLVLCNQRYRDLYWSSADLITPGARYEDLLRASVARGQFPDAIGREEDWIAERLDQRRDPRETVEQHLADGTWLQISERRTADGGLVGIATDVTRLKHHERQLQVSIDDLGRSKGLLAEQADALAALADEMALERERADRASRAKSDFLGAMSRKIRTPMSGVLGTIDLLLNGDLRPEQRRYLQPAKESSESLLAVLNDVLDYSKLEAGRLEFESAEFSLPQVVDDVMSLQGGQARAKGLRLEASVAADVPPALVGDAARVRQILLNLVGHALGVAETGSIAVDARHKMIDAETAEVHVDIRHAGPGLAESSAAALFEPFTPGSGSGLGLAICKQLVEHMGGAIGVENETGPDGEGRVGSRFWFTLRAKRAESSGVIPTPAELPPHSFGRPLHVLVAEDNQLNQRVLRAMLEQHGHHVDSAVNGLEALEAASRAPYDVILMDVHMPAMDGLSAARAIRQLPDAAGRTPIVALTTEGLAETATDYSEAGINAQIAKPIHADALLEVMTRLIGVPAPPLAEVAAVAAAPAAPPPAAETGSVHTMPVRPRRRRAGPAPASEPDAAAAPSAAADPGLARVLAKVRRLTGEGD